MNEPIEPLLLTNPEAFMQYIARTDDNRFDGLQTLDDWVVSEFLRYGLIKDDSLLSHIGEFYDEIFLEAATEKRREIFMYVRDIVKQSKGKAAGAFLPFVICDPDIRIVASATIAYVTFAELINNDPMTRPRDMLGMVEQRLPRNPCACYGALLYLGDPRVCELIRPMRDSFSLEEVHTITNCSSGFLYKCVVEFHLDWLDDLMDRTDDVGQGLFGRVAATLAHIVRIRNVPFVLDGLRPFPFLDTDNDYWVTRIDWDDYLPTISERLFDIEANEAPPRFVLRSTARVRIDPTL